MSFETVATLLMVLIGFQATQHWGFIHIHSKTAAEISDLARVVPKPQENTRRNHRTQFTSKFWV